MPLFPRIDHLTRIRGWGSTQFWQCQDFGCIWSSNPPLKTPRQIKSWRRCWSEWVAVDPYPIIHTLTLPTRQKKRFPTEMWEKIFGQGFSSHEGSEPSFDQTFSWHDMKVVSVPSDCLSHGRRFFPTPGWKVIWIVVLVTGLCLVIQSVLLGKFKWTAASKLSGDYSNKDNIVISSILILTHCKPPSQKRANKILSTRMQYHPNPIPPHNNGKS